MNDKRHKKKSHHYLHFPYRTTTIERTNKQINIQQINTRYNISGTETFLHENAEKKNFKLINSVFLFDSGENQVKIIKKNSGREKCGEVNNFVITVCNRRVILL